MNAAEAVSQLGVMPPERQLFQARPTEHQFRRITPAKYDRMRETGVLREAESVELLEGFIVNKLRRKPAHDWTMTLFRRVLPKLAPNNFPTRFRSAITTSESEPESDAVIARAAGSFDTSRHPTAADIGIVMESSGTHLESDRATKCRINARAGLPVCRIIYLPDRRVEVSAQPDSGNDSPAYQSHVEYPAGDQVPIVMDGQDVAYIPVSTLLL